MPEKKSAAEVLRVLVERVRQIERQAAAVAAVIEKMVATIEQQRATATPKPES